MSVYTSVTVRDVDAWLLRYAVGTLADLVPIAGGIENTNYFVTTDNGRYVLTLYERLPAEDLPFYLNLMAHLAKAGCSVPAPQADRTGALFSMLNGKPAGLVERIDGRVSEAPSVEECAAVGRALARMHVAALIYRPRLANRRGPSWWRQAARAVRPYLQHEQQVLIAAELAYQASLAKVKLPKAAIHADLFCDNVLFDDVGEVAGIIDFGFAATDSLAYDVAIAVNDWCDAGDGSLDAERTRAFVSSYSAVRPMNDDERELWPALLRAAALRFWLSRLYDLHLPRPGELTHAHDPARFESILRHRVAKMPRMPEVAAS
ncbi:MAG TPA: homoserine kinase [Casimicrobiaceae bacterium]|nr:homoserine kinase [Casimicrobiaceae bacterium]